MRTLANTHRPPGPPCSTAHAVRPGRPRARAPPPPPPPRRPCAAGASPSSGPADFSDYSNFAREGEQSAISLRGVQVQFARGAEGGGAGQLVLKGVDLEVKRGTLHMLLGPNGCGKVRGGREGGAVPWPQHERGGSAASTCTATPRAHHPAPGLACTR